MSVEQQQTEQQGSAHSVDRLEAALKQLGFALEQHENQAELQRKATEARMTALFERIKTLETRITSLLGETTETEERK